MQEARQYGYDGYNIDFEYVKKDFADDYLQFVAGTVYRMPE